jgi:organic hydroperoxide reductase OsmC/OhrA
MSDVVSEFSITLDQVEDFQFLVRFDKETYAPLTMDEPPPFGKDSGPGAARALAAAVGNCLSSSLLFASRKNGLALGQIHTTAKVQIVRNQQRRLRIGKIEVNIDPRLGEHDPATALRVRESFEDFCTVTASIRQGITVEVNVKGIPNSK